MATYPPVPYNRRNRKAVQCLWLFIICILVLIGVYVHGLWDTLDRPIVRPITRPSLLKIRKAEIADSSATQKHLNGDGQRKELQEELTQKSEQGNGGVLKGVLKGLDKDKTLPITEDKQLDKPSAKFVHIFDEDQSNNNATCVNYKMLMPVKGVTILCVHSDKDDMFVSGSFLQGRIWEENMVQAMGTVLVAHPEMIFIDVGSHMGMYTMYANKAGNQVIAIDPLTKNLRLLRKSVTVTQQEKHVTLLLNAVSDKHEELYLEEGQANNIGSTHLVAADKTVDKSRLAADYKVQTILLDDLLEVFELDNKEVMMKMDVEGYEWNALQGGRAFFNRVNVCYVLLEFASHKMRPSGMEIITFMVSHNLYPHDRFVGYNRLPLNDTNPYSIDVVFIKDTEQCKKHA